MRGACYLLSLPNMSRWRTNAASTRDSRLPDSASGNRGLRVLTSREQDKLLGGPGPKLLHKILWIVVAVGAALVPTIISASGKDVFRLDKILVFEAFAIAAGALLLIGLTWH